MHPAFLYSYRLCKMYNNSFTISIICNYFPFVFYRSNLYTRTNSAAKRGKYF
ncbi:hypothetical protein RchiOBHm_Chr6g0264291 [Rosa chinensis]|uniref:Uncharacterized protein n=1 Tax=Rosa chinensis TaxID=74649 RepID=A0A2P6PP36_ROSCH|nr:hypothetical protein RchiOBHm_Chr6g0264291 [Rosa chinensis]